MLLRKSIFFVLSCGCLFALAQPAQRIIVQFTEPLTTDARVLVHKQLETALKRELQLAEPSDNKRWIVILQPPLSGDELKKILGKIESIPQVSFAEPDTLVQPSF